MHQTILEIFCLLFCVVILSVGKLYAAMKAKIKYISDIIHRYKLTPACSPDLSPCDFSVLQIEKDVSWVQNQNSI